LDKWGLKLERKKNSVFVFLLNNLMKTMKKEIYINLEFGLESSKNLGKIQE